ncbi:MAG: hypothetical protein AUG49_25040 [Catenulispora sp. 13_1_20CM_3_70_7]|nr:MAG: hypothetical protein AUG49_25040 [Catenulispora sp. 13_1_20CM_3_70_7]
MESTRSQADDPAPLADDVVLADRQPGVVSGSTAWIEKGTSTLSDGSTATLSQVVNGDRVEVNARAP